MRLDGVGVETAGVDGGVQLGRLAGVDGSHGVEPANVTLEPLEYQAGQVPGVGGRGIDHGVACRQGLVVEQAGNARAALFEQVVAHQHQGQAGGADVLLRSGVEQAKAGDIQGLGEDVGRDVAHQRDVDLGNVV